LNREDKNPKRDLSAMSLAIQGLELQAVRVTGKAFRRRAAIPDAAFALAKVQNAPPINNCA
jgi:hypothetical protein